MQFKGLRHPALPDSPASLDHLYIYVYAESVGISWDEKKAKSNHQKHEVFFADAVLVLEDP